MRTSVMGALICAFGLAACAGRDPNTVATSQPQDIYASCAQLQAEIAANNTKVTQLAEEQGWKTAQNVTAGVVGLVVWPVWFAMDFKGAADKDVAALQARQQYLAILATERCAPQAPQRRTAGRPPAGQPAAAPPPVTTGQAVAQRLPPEAYYQPPPKPTPPPAPEYGASH